MTQFTYPDLKAMRNIDIQHINPDTMPDIRDINVDNEKSLLDRTLDYINKIKNPYCIRCGKIIVKIEYAETETTIEDCMEGYFRSLI
ncbi:MAG: hypothetical protein FWD71_13870 [Oscillospiraceae bacterium]|nr:hypothetical protein [Oscillospiraceae bacterium]